MISNIDVACTDAIVGTKEPTCNIDFGYINKVIIKKRAGTLSVAGHCPSATEFTIGLASSGDDKLVVVGVQDAKLLDGEQTVLSGAIVNGEDRLILTVQQLTAQVNNLDRDSIRMLSTIGVHGKIDMWVITNTGYCFGSTDGFRGSIIVSPITIDGFGVLPNKKIAIKTDMTNRKDWDYLQDDDYGDLVNPSDSSTTTEN